MRRIIFDLNENRLTESEIESTREKYFSELTRGLFICDQRESDQHQPPQPLAIREHYYYFTQYFTEGDLLDPADLYNHPWLILIRGKTDVWRFLDLIKAQNPEVVTWVQAQRSHC